MPKRFVPVSASAAQRYVRCDDVVGRLAAVEKHRHLCENLAHTLLFGPGSDALLAPWN